MSWLFASFAIVLGVLGAGWLAYERSRPSVRMVAVVATLAAVAALGRDAFVALPDVKPITAMTFVVGYALGPLPGFTVGAVGMLASNVVLGQGAYTPWQMVAWGLVGVAGAVLGRLSGRRLGRFGLALCCAATATGAKEIMNLYTWTLGASHTPAALLAVAGAALPFDVTDAVSSFLFALVFAPELARLLARVRSRMDVRWEPAQSIPPALLVLAFAIGATVAGHSGELARASAGGSGRPTVAVRASERTRPAVGASASLSSEVAYLQRAQNRDGGFGAAPGQRSSELYSAWAAMALAAAGRDPATVERDGHTVLGSIRGEMSTLEGAGDVERTILALRACGVAAGSIPRALLDKLLAVRAADGSFGRLVNITTFAIFALRAVGRSARAPVVRAAAHWLARQQNGDGSFSFSAKGAPGDVDDTAAALQGLVDAGLGHGRVVSRATTFLRGAQDADGGYPQEIGDASNAQSTAWAVQGLIAAGRDPRTVTRAGSRSPRSYLETLVAPDGSVRYSRTSSQTPVWVTAQAVIALAGKPFPLAAPRNRAHIAPAAARGDPASAEAQPRGSAARAAGDAARRSHRHRRFGSTGKQTGLVAAVGRSAQDWRQVNALAHAVGLLVGVALRPIAGA